MRTGTDVRVTGTVGRPALDGQVTIRTTNNSASKGVRTD